MTITKPRILEDSALYDEAARQSTRSASPSGRQIVWLVTELYWPEETSTGMVLTRIAEKLARVYDVRVICGKPNYSMRGVRVPRTEERNGVRIRRCTGTRLDKDVVPFRIANALSLGASMFLRELLNFRRGDVILVVTTPPSLPPLAALAARLRGASCILVVHDVYPDIAVAAGLVKRGSLSARIVDTVLKRVYMSARAIAVLGRDMGELIERKMGERPAAQQSSIVVIPNFAEIDRVSPAPRDENPLLRELGLVNKFVVQIAGNLGQPHAVDTLCEAALRLRAVNDVHFLVIGSGVRMPALREYVERERLENVTIIGPRPRADQQVFLNACDVALMTFVEGMWGVGVPSRTYNILAAGKPIIAAMDPTSEIGRLVEEEGVGWQAGVEHPERIVNCILEARANPDRLREMGNRASDIATSKYSIEQFADHYQELVSRVAANR